MGTDFTAMQEDFEKRVEENERLTVLLHEAQTAAQEGSGQTENLERENAQLKARTRVLEMRLQQDNPREKELMSQAQQQLGEFKKMMDRQVSLVAERESEVCVDCSGVRGVSADSMGVSVCLCFVSCIDP